MSDEPSPRPWTLFVHEEQEGGDGEISICADGEWIATMNLRRSTAKDDAALIVDAVNAIDATKKLSIKLYDPIRRAEAERDRLRDLVRDALPFIEGAIDVVSTILGDAEMSKAAGECGAPPKDVMEAFVADGRRVLREVRAAIGEDAK